MKIICMCKAGNSRSVALAYILKERFKHEAIAIGITTTSRKTRRMLYDWADVIILVIDERFKRWIPEEYWDKLKVWDVGRDIYFRDYDHALKEKFNNFIKSEGL